MAIDQPSVLPPVESVKRCTKCGKEKPISLFCKDSHKKSGYQSHCKECNSMYCETWRLENQDHYRSCVKSYCENNRELLRKKNLEYISTHSEQRKAAKKAWKLANPQKVSTYHRNRKAIKRNAEGSHTASDIQQLLVLQKHKCAVCRISIANGYHVDHVIPLSLGGTNDKGNLQILCPHCNLSKNAQPPVDFMQSRGMLL